MSDDRHVFCLGLNIFLLFLLGYEVFLFILFSLSLLNSETIGCLCQKPKKEAEPKLAEAPQEKKTEAVKSVESSPSSSGQVLTCKNPANF